MVKKIVETPLNGNYLKEWRAFVGHINSSNPFKELWDKLCFLRHSTQIALQSDCPTRFSSTITMIEQAVKFKYVVEDIWDITAHSSEWRKHHVYYFIFIVTFN